MSRLEHRRPGARKILCEPVVEEQLIAGPSLTVPPHSPKRDNISLMGKYVRKMHPVPYQGSNSVLQFTKALFRRIGVFEGQNHGGARVV